jgi:Cu/Zn superoxide dismutase
MMLKASLFFSTAMAAYCKTGAVKDCEAQDIKRKAICVLDSQPGQKAKGIVNFKQTSEFAETEISAKFHNLSPNHAHGFHIH